MIKTTDEEFIKIWHNNPSATEVSKILGITLTNVHKRRRSILKRHGIVLMSPDPRSPTFNVTIPNNGVRVEVEITNGVIVVGSDSHYWPGIISTAHRAFVKIIKDLKPQMVIMNGDAFDGAKISRHPVSGFEARPSVKQELEAVTDRLGEIEKVCGNAKLHWTWGNHDLRFNTRIAQLVPEYEGVTGFDLTHHFPRWKFSTSIMVNNHVIIILSIFFLLIFRIVSI